MYDVICSGYYVNLLFWQDFNGFMRRILTFVDCGSNVNLGSNAPAVLFWSSPFSSGLHTVCCL